MGLFLYIVTEYEEYLRRPNEHDLRLLCVRFFMIAINSCGIYASILQESDRFSTDFLKQIGSTIANDGNDTTYKYVYTSFDSIENFVSKARARRVHENVQIELTLNWLFMSNIESTM